MLQSTLSNPGTPHGRDVRVGLTYRPIAGLHLDPLNPRRHSRRQIRQIARSIETFGFNVPVLVDADLKVIAGHGRVMASRELGLHEVPTIGLEHLSEAQARAYLIADNKLAENASWDERLLGQQLKELSALDLDFSLDITGFEMGEVDLLIEGVTAAKPDRADEPPEPGPAVTREGDLWQLGRHRILCASALDDASYRTLMGEKRAAMVFTDPPYNVRIDGHAGGLGAIHHRPFPMATGEMSEGEFTDFLARACGLLARHSVQGALHFLCIDWRHMGELLAAGKRVYCELKNVCVWVKDSPGMGSLYRSQHELIFVFIYGKGRHRNNIELGRHGRNRSNVWRYPSVFTFGRRGEEGNLLAVHPTVKPVAMVADALMDCSGRGEIVLDGFLGSGTTLIAAERTGRIGYGLELDPLYVDAAIRRWQSFTRQSAVHAESGRTFDEMAGGDNG